MVTLLKTHQIFPIVLKMKPRHFIMVSEALLSGKNLPGFSWCLSPVAENVCQLWVTFKALLPPHYAFPHAFSLSVYHAPSLALLVYVQINAFCIWLTPSCPLGLNSNITFSDTPSLPAQSVKVLLCFLYQSTLLPWLHLSQFGTRLKIRLLNWFLAGCQTLWLGCKLPERTGCVRLPQLHN